MTRGEFWSRKLVLADTLNNPSAIDDMINAATAECVCSQVIEGVVMVDFPDGSFLRVRPVSLKDGRTAGEVGWGAK